MTLTQPGRTELAAIVLTALLAACGNAGVGVPSEPAAPAAAGNGIGGQSGGGQSDGQGGNQAGSMTTPAVPVDVAPPTAGASGASTGGAGTSPDPTPGLPVVPEAGAPVLPCTFELCESFEDVPVGDPPSSALWQNVADGMLVDSVRAFRGSKALHLPAFAGKGSYMMQTTKGLPLPGKLLFGRAFFWIENAPPFGQTYLHWALVNAIGKNAAGNEMQHQFGGQAFEGKPGNYLSYNSWSPQGYSGAHGLSHPVGVPLKSWQCVEWSFDTTLSQAQFWWNGAELTELAFKNPPGKPQFDFPEFRSVSIGWSEFHDSASPWEVWIDEIALGSERIRCDR